MLASNWHEGVLKFWFEELSPRQWYVSTPEIDNTIRQRFEPLIEQLASSTPSSLVADPRKLLAAIITLDQFPRNIHRGSHKAFDHDARALAMSEEILSHKLDHDMSKNERQFCYMPFMHAENIDSQHTAVELFTQLGSKEGAESAIEHRDIIAQFGRFPHRNDVLKRESTPAEIDYLVNAKRFGQ